jgi:outer membrane receptor protein involved in Fe transport
MLAAGLRGQLQSDRPAELLTSAGLTVSPLGPLSLGVVWGEGVRPASFESTALVTGTPNLVSFGADPEIPAARSRSLEVDLELRLPVATGVVREWGLRGTYAFAEVDDLVTRDEGAYGSADRRLHSFEQELWVQFRGGHELTASYAYLVALDLDLGRVRNVPEHVASLTGRYAVLGERLGLHAGVRLRGPSEDLNRSVLLVTAADASTTSAETPIRVPPTALEVTEIPFVPLLRVGLTSRGLFGHLDVSLWVENALDVDYADADIDFEARIATRPIPRPRWSATLDARVRF